MDQADNKPKIAIWLDRNHLKFELPLVFLFLASIIMMDQNMDYGKMIAGVSLSALAVIYFLLAFSPADDKASVIIIVKKIMGISWSVATVGIQFYIFNFPGYQNMLMFGSIGLTASTVILLISELLKGGLKSKIQLIRSAVILFVSVFIFFNS